MDQKCEINVEQIKETLSADTSRDDDKLNVIHNLKNYLNASKGNFSGVSLASILDNTLTLHSSFVQDTTFLFQFGQTLINYFGRDSKVDCKILIHIEFVLLELSNKNTECFDILIEQLWERFKHLKIYCAEVVERILKFSESFLEELVLNWIESEPDFSYFAHISSNSPNFFQGITGILHQILIFTQGNSKVLKVIESFVECVLSLCEAEQKNFLKLYPTNCVSIVPLLMVPPEIYPDGENCDKLVTRSFVGSILMEKFFSDSDETLIVLSHFPKWLLFLQNYLRANNS